MNAFSWSKGLRKALPIKFIMCATHVTCSESGNKDCNAALCAFFVYAALSVSNTITFSLAMQYSCRHLTTETETVERLHCCRRAVSARWARTPP